MKKLFILLSCLTIFYTTQAQVRFGIKGHIQFTNITDVHWNSETRSFAIALGGFAQIPLERNHDNLFLRPELLYSQQGEYDGEVKYFHDYINVPILAKYYFSDFITLDEYGEIEIFLEGGPQLGFLINEKNKEKDEKFYGKVNKLDLSFGLGTGISFQRKYELGIRYNYGISDTYKNYPKNNTISNLGIFFSYTF